MEGVMRKVGRNDPCPCGSGLKYKRCCLNKDRESDRSKITESSRKRVFATSTIQPRFSKAKKRYLSQSAKKGLCPP